MSNLTTYFTLIKSLKGNIPSQGDIEAKFAKEYNKQLKGIEESMNTDLSEYYIPDSEFHRRVTMVEGGYSFSPYEDAQESKVHYSDELYVDGIYFHMKLDALLMLFTISQQEVKIGFNLN